MTRPRAVSLSSTSGDDVRELTPAEVARLASRPSRPRVRQRAVRAQPADVEVIVISDSESPVRNRPSFQERLARLNATRGQQQRSRNSSGAAFSNNNFPERDYIQYIEEQRANFAARQEQVLAALGFGFEPRPAVRRQTRNRGVNARRMPSPNQMPLRRPYSDSFNSHIAALQRVLMLPLNDAVDAMSYDELLELGRRVGNVRQRGADSRKISRLRKRNWKAVKKTLPESSEMHGCAICIEDFLDTDTVTILACKHMFHTDCSKKWLVLNASCPVCRASIDGIPAST